MKDRKFLSVLFILFFALSCVFSAQDNLSVPLTSDAYRIIDVGEMRGIIPDQSDVKPYSLGTVRKLLRMIYEDPSTTKAERAAIEEALSILNRSFGGDGADNLLDSFRKGYLNIVDSNQISVNVGAKATTMQTLGFGKDLLAFDSRNKISFYVAGDATNHVSYYMDLGMIFDKLNHKAFLATDFTSECEGVYMDAFNGGGGIYSAPFNSFATGYQMTPELGFSALDGKLTARFGAVKRNWGPGVNNLALSGSARTFDALDVTFSPSPRFSFSVINGSLGKAWVELEDEPCPVGDKYMHANEFDNNFSMQRVEVELFEGFRAAIYESVVWRKRAELAYWNPLAVYMFVQNYLGDFDNVLAGMDFSYTIKGLGKVYFAFAFDEMNSVNPKNLFTFARNIIAVQGGAEFAVPGSSFSKLTVQATYIPPFWGTHYIYKSNPWGNGLYSTAYVNKGQSLSYPLNPDSIEILAKYETTFPMGICASFIVKDQMRSAQYSTNDKTGTGLADYMRYSKDYENKHFFSYIWNNIVDLELSARKTLEKYPLSFNIGLRCIVDSRRSYSLNSLVEWYAPSEDDDMAYGDGRGDDDGSSEYANRKKFNFGNGTTMNSDWKTDVRVAVSIGVSIYY